ncbi:MAG: hypothetical protein ABIV06_06645, partial [Thermoanaerobaculia bacterium]
LILWAEPSQATPAPVTCGARPTFVDACQYLQTTAFDEAANGQLAVRDFIVTEVASRRQVGSSEIPVAAPFGFVDVENRVELGCLLEPFGDVPKQLWVMPVSSASGQFSVGMNGHRIGDELCPVPVL